MKLHVINTGFFKLDGGTMFGVVPKSIWNNLNPADSNNMCTWALRCLLIEDEKRLILIDNGVGNKQSEKFFSYYYLHGDDTLEKSLKKAGFSCDDITDMFLTHLHFDHCGGSIKRENDKLITSFKNATYWVNKNHWEWAIKPNTREKPSFLKENILPIQESGQLKFIENEIELFPFLKIIPVSGHTESMMIPHITFNGNTIVFVTDLIPSSGHIPVPYIMGYDVKPLLTLKEKEEFLEKAVQNNFILFFEHDPKIECCTLKRTEKGIRINEAFSLNEIIGK